MILCGVDRSDEAAQAARFAADLAVRAGTRLILLHVAPQPWISTHSPESYERMREQEAFDRAGHLGTVVNPIRVDPAASVERVVEFGQPVDVLRSVAEARGVTHLVVGSRGQGAVEEVLAASTSGALAREAPCPVILVPAEPAAWSDDSADATIVCGVDGSDGSLAAARQAAELAQRLNARLVLATVIQTLGDEPPLALVEELRAGAPGARIYFQTLSGVAADKLLELARSRDAPLVVVGSRGRGAVKAAVLGSVSGRLVQETDRPVMVVSKRSATMS
jgi:nucleotide-binding universal stress UspA family protein